jgi:hypothetical protein
VPYEWQANRVIASNAGLTDTEIEATQSDGPLSGIALFLNGTRVPLETTDKIGSRTSPLG